MLTSECKRELEERDGRPTTRPKAVVHNFDVRISPAELRINHDQPDSPVRDATEDNEQEEAGEETSLANSVRKTCENEKRLLWKAFASVPMIPDDECQS